MAPWRRMGKSSEVVLCLSHLRWNLVYQRPQHLMVRCAQHHRVVFVEGPVFDVGEPELELRAEPCGTVATPHLPPGTSEPIAESVQRKLIDRVLDDLGQPRPVLWYLTPAALAFTHHVKPRAIVYDCTDEASRFQGATPRLAAYEAALLQHADVLFTGEHGLYDYQHIAMLPDEALPSGPAARRVRADQFRATMSWDRTWQEMWGHVQRAIDARAALCSSGLHPITGDIGGREASTLQHSPDHRLSLG
jgi:hypothetical protein